MNFNDMIKNLSIQDAMILNMVENGYSAEKIASELGLARQTVFNTKKKYEAAREAVNASHSKYMDIVRPTPERRNGKVM